jgi:PAS domain S-box-containing protein
MPELQRPARPAFLGSDSEMAMLVATHDWASTSLGPLDRWPPSLAAAVGLMLQANLPMSLLVGEDGVVIYNDAHARLIGKRHPHALGTKGRESWPELADLMDRAISLGLAGETLALRDFELTIYPAGAPTKVWLNVDASPVLDETGRPFAVLSLIIDNTQRVLAQRKAAAQVRRRRQMLELAPGAMCFMSGPDLVVEFVNEAHKSLFGHADAVGQPFAEAFADLLAANEPGVFLHAITTGERFVGRGARIRIPKPGGAVEERRVDFVIEPMLDDLGRAEGLFTETFDLTELVRAQEAIAESRKRLSAALSVARLGVFEWDAATDTLTFDARVREIYGFGPDDPITLETAKARIESQDLPRIYADATESISGGRTRRELEFRIRRPDGAVREVVSISDAYLGRAGGVLRVIGVTHDVTERRASERRRQLLINELNHRVKNTLATVQSLAAQTLRSAPDLPAAREAFEARLVALAAAHDLLTAQSWQGAWLGDVAATAMAPFEVTNRPQISRSGPAVWLKAHQAMALSLALHELATNAGKYGALSLPEGRVKLRWSRTSAGELTLAWSETGGPRVAPPARAGFGTRLLQRSLSHELRGEVNLAFPPEGVRCEIRFPLDGVDAGADPVAPELRPRATPDRS